MLRLSSFCVVALQLQCYYTVVVITEALQEMSKLFETFGLSRIDICFDGNFQRRVARDDPYTDVTRSD